MDQAVLTPQDWEDMIKFKKMMRELGVKDEAWAEKIFREQLAMQRVLMPIYKPLMKVLSRVEKASTLMSMVMMAPSFASFINAEALQLHMGVMKMALRCKRWDDFDRFARRFEMEYYKDALQFQIVYGWMNPLTNDAYFSNMRTVARDFNRMKKNRLTMEQRQKRRVQNI